MNVGVDHFECPRCGETKPRTPAFFYFNWLGQVVGYCRPCHAAYGRAYRAERMTPAQKDLGRESSP